MRRVGGRGVASSELNVPYTAPQPPPTASRHTKFNVTLTHSAAALQL